MLLGPTYVYKCPNCGHHLKKGSLMSGNTFGAKIYSDGKTIARMLREFPNLTKCKKCNKIFWLSKLKEIGTLKWSDKNSKWQSADNAEFLEIDDYFKALDSGIAENKQEELYIRKRIWYAYNDRVRIIKVDQFIDENDEIKWKENCNKLISLLDQSDLNQRIMIAELSRNLGDFEACLDIIIKIDNDDLNWLKQKFILECEQKNKWVIQLN